MQGNPLSPAELREFSQVLITLADFSEKTGFTFNFQPAPLTVEVSVSRPSEALAATIAKVASGSKKPHEAKCWCNVCTHKHRTEVDRDRNRKAVERQRHNPRDIIMALPRNAWSIEDDYKLLFHHLAGRGPSDIGARMDKPAAVVEARIRVITTHYNADHMFKAAADILGLPAEIEAVS
ncbi:hypothetical protein [Ketogulonicigenium vulgare]|uniref:hypothetical protein n=1 Tax=Ketogulonicigenium vulgare TaxID=92945 RepID=UPI0023589015|nr:hypothetical protein [Ketogulonicigenium vulgare]